MDRHPTQEQVSITRREALKRLGLVFGASAAGGLLIACQPGPAPSGNLATSTAGTTGTKAKLGGELRYTMLAADPVLLDPHQTVFGEDIYSTSPCYNNLVYFNYYDKAPYTIDPDLAEKWDVSADGKTYTFHLVKNALFHDGTPFTSADAKYSLDRVRNPSPAW